MHAKVLSVTRNTQIKLLGAVYSTCIACSFIIHIHVYSLQTTAAELTWHDLIAMKSWEECNDNSISGFIALHGNHTCDNFASLLLKAPNLIVNAIRREAQGDNNQFIQTVLQKWYSKEGNPVPITWRYLIQCMKDAGLDHQLVQVIEGKDLGKFCIGDS